MSRYNFGLTEEMKNMLEYAYVQGQKDGALLARDAIRGLEFRPLMNPTIERDMALEAIDKVLKSFEI